MGSELTAQAVSAYAGDVEEHWAMLERWRRRGPLGMQQSESFAVTRVLKDVFPDLAKHDNLDCWKHRMVDAHEVSELLQAHCRRTASRRGGHA